MFGQELAEDDERRKKYRYKYENKQGPMAMHGEISLNRHDESALATIKRKYPALEILVECDALLEAVNAKAVEEKGLGDLNALEQMALAADQVVPNSSLIVTTDDRLAVLLIRSQRRPRRRRTKRLVCGLTMRTQTTKKTVTTKNGYRPTEGAQVPAAAVVVVVVSVKPPPRRPSGRHGPS